jgi:hypothetical protein
MICTQIEQFLDRCVEFATPKGAVRLIASGLSLDDKSLLVTSS